MRDEKGEDEKILTVPVGEPRFDEMHDLRDVPKAFLNEIENFFATYKLLEEESTELRGWDDADEARTIIEEAQQRHQETLRESVPH
jgi:inorganic pyrophosphatase